MVTPGPAATGLLGGEGSGWLIWPPERKGTWNGAPGTPPLAYSTGWEAAGSRWATGGAGKPAMPDENKAVISRSSIPSLDS